MKHPLAEVLQKLHDRVELLLVGPAMVKRQREGKSRMDRATQALGAAAEEFRQSVEHACGARAR